MFRAPMKQDNSADGSRAAIGRTTRIVGRLTGDGDLVVEGRVEGELTLKGHLHVAEGGVVAAPVNATDLTVEGTVDGDVDARGAVMLRSTGAVRGAIRAARVSLEEGAKFTGRIEMDVDLPAELSGRAAATGQGRARGEGKRG
jgi:cytoskeletal protein CcmA (bactofilin family)